MKKNYTLIALILLFSGLLLIVISLFISNVEVFILGALAALLSMPLLFINK
jgi:hypothetical protein